ncbi:uncharacterized protein LOC111341920 [Stylophora pistillata]|uniref:uncharacterized protein LOC111341920 n=1 Tax=Stylophora pistillata TaxID=50429 RepID=UPI000C0417AD|nr:uncharacterized protein LOC111341920 [Stylophora pistillata]
MFSKITIILFFLFSYYCYGDEACCGRFMESFDSLLYNRVLIGRVIKSLFTRRGIFSCAYRCLSLPSCSSYNYQTLESDYGVCELNGKEGGQETLKERAGFVFARRRKTPRSCKEARELTIKPASAYFCIKDNNGDMFKVYCDFTSEPGWAWTLVMSESLENVGKPFTRQALFTNEPMSPEVPNWEAYRLQLDRMKGLRSESTHWRITCSFDPASLVNYRDYVRAKFKNFDLLTYVGDATCEHVDYINVHGHSCENCTALWYQSTGYILVHRSFDTRCDFGRAPGSIHSNGDSEQNFGRYVVCNHNFRCTSNSSATTSYWFGSRI